MRIWFANPDFARGMTLPAGDDNCANDDIRKSERFLHKAKQGLFASDRRNGAFLLSTDGVNPYTSLNSTKSWWPVTMQLLNLDERLRKDPRYVMLLGIFTTRDQKSPKDIQLFLQLVVDEIIDLYYAGCTMVDSSKPLSDPQRIFTWRALIFGASFDYQGTYMLSYTHRQYSWMHRAITQYCVSFMCAYAWILSLYFNHPSTSVINLDLRIMNE
jgi:hypothetical protein